MEVEVLRADARQRLRRRCPEAARPPASFDVTSSCTMMPNLSGRLKVLMVATARCGVGRGAVAGSERAVGGSSALSIAAGSIVASDAGQRRVWSPGEDCVTPVVGNSARRCSAARTTRPISRSRSTWLLRQDATDLLSPPARCPDRRREPLWRSDVRFRRDFVLLDRPHHTVALTRP